MQTYFLKSIFSDDFFFLSTISRNLNGAECLWKLRLCADASAHQILASADGANPRQGVLDVGVDGRVGSDACC